MTKSALAAFALVTSLLLGHAAPSAGRCDPEGAASALASTEKAVRDGCDCAGAASHRDYLGCARGIVRGEVAAGRLPASCRAEAQRYAARSTCGRAAAVSCCLSLPDSPWWRGTLRRSAGQCRSPGGACVSTLPHLADACGESGCRSTVCGDGQISYVEGEDCDPPEPGYCDARCRFIATCGNGVIEGGEECDGDVACDAACRLTLQKGCCDLDDHCVGASDPLGLYGLATQCSRFLGGTFSYSACEGAEACQFAPDPGLTCRIGSCTDGPIDPLPLCCQNASGGCRDTIATTAGAIGTFACPAIFQDPGAVNVDRLMLGTCGASGRCVPAH